MARVTPIAVAFFFVATVISAVLLFTGRSATVEESAGHLSITQTAADQAANASARRYAE